MSKKKYDPKYIEDANKRLWNILNDKKEFDDWTQISLSVQNAVQAAANVWGTSSDEQIHNLAKFIREIVESELHNLLRFDITFADKKTKTTRQSVEWWHKHNYGNLQALLKQLIKEYGGRIELIDCHSIIRGSDEVGNDCERPVIIKALSLKEKELIEITYIDKDQEFVDASDLFTYDELYDILCNACQSLNLWLNK